MWRVKNEIKNEGKMERKKEGKKGESVKKGKIFKKYSKMLCFTKETLNQIIFPTH